MPRVLILCTHNSARSQIGEAWLHALSSEHGVDLDVQSAGTQATAVKPQAALVMAEVGLDLSGHRSKTLWDVPDPWTFDHVLTVCDSAAEACPSYPAQTERRHYPFTDPSGEGLDRWRAVRDQMRVQLERFVLALKNGQAAPPSYATAPAV